MPVFDRLLMGTESPSPRTSAGLLRPARYVVRLIGATTSGAAIVVPPDLEGELFVEGSKAPGTFVIGRGPSKVLSLSHESSLLRVRALGHQPGELGGVRFRDVLLEGGEELAVGGLRLRVTRTSHDDEATRCGGMMGASSSMLAAFARARVLSRSGAHFFVVGEAMTGRRSFALAVHDESPYAERPACVVSCKNVTAEELATRLSAPTSEHGPGLVVLDDAADLSREARDVVRVALARPISSCRIVGIFTAPPDASPKRDPRQGFEDLAVETVTLTPFRERRDDACEIARMWWRQAGRRDSLPGAVAAQLSTALLVDNAEDVRAIVLREVMAPPLRGGDQLTFIEARRRAIEEFELRYLAGALQRTKGNVTRAAATSGLTRRYFHALMARAKRSP